MSSRSASQSGSAAIARSVIGGWQTVSRLARTGTRPTTVPTTGFGAGFSTPIAVSAATGVPPISVNTNSGAKESDLIASTELGRTAVRAGCDVVKIERSQPPPRSTGHSHGNRDGHVAAVTLRKKERIAAGLQPVGDYGTFSVVSALSSATSTS